jgi:spore coat protein U-like protein
MNMRTHIRLMLLGLLAFVAYAPATYAQGSVSTTFSVSAHVDPSCDVTATNLEFGNYFDGASTPTDAQSTVEVKCVSGLSYDVGLGNGGHASGSGNYIRHMQRNGGSELLHYGLFIDAARNNPWFMTTNFQTGTGTGVFQSYNVYGRITVGQNVPTGDYSDTVTVTVSWL